jgi:hypothetical protein
MIQYIYNYNGILDTFNISNVIIGDTFVLKKCGPMNQ